jgi:hypothetical protein
LGFFIGFLLGFFMPVADSDVNKGVMFMKSFLLFLLMNSTIAMGQSLPAEPLPPDESSFLFSFGEEMLQRINYIRGQKGIPLLWKSEAAPRRSTGPISHKLILATTEGAQCYQHQGSA